MSYIKYYVNFSDKWKKETKYWKILHDIKLVTFGPFLKITSELSSQVYLNLYVLCKCAWLLTVQVCILVLCPNKFGSTNPRLNEHVYFTIRCYTFRVRDEGWNINRNGTSNRCGQIYCCDSFIVFTFNCIEFFLLLTRYDKVMSSCSSVSFTSVKDARDSYILAINKPLYLTIVLLILIGACFIYVWKKKVFLCKEKYSLYDWKNVSPICQDLF